MIIQSIHTNSIIKELPTEGHSPLLILGSDYEMYVAKNDKGKQPPFALVNEFLSSYFFDKWGIASPLVKLISIADILITSKESLSKNHRAYFYDTPCFGSKFVKNSVDVNALLVTDKKKAYNKLNNPIDVFHITLFDTWVENDDRKPTNYNLILEPFNNKFNIVPIDNAFIFSSMSYEDLNPSYGVSVSVNDHLLVSDLGNLIKRNTIIDVAFINNEREYFYLCIERCEQSFDSYMTQIAVFYTIDTVLVENLEVFMAFVSADGKTVSNSVYLGSGTAA